MLRAVYLTVALALCACSGKTVDVASANDDHPEKEACDAYVSDFGRCMGKLSREPFDLAPMRARLEHTAEDPTKRPELRAHCEAERARLATSCR